MMMKSLHASPWKSRYGTMSERWNAERNRQLQWNAKFAAGLAILVLCFVAPGRAQDAGNSRKLTLKEAVSLAVGNSRDLALARLRYGIVQRQAGLTRSAFRPNLYTGTGVAYTTGFPILDGGGAPAIFSLSYNQQIFNPPLKGDQRAAEQRAEGAAAFHRRRPRRRDGARGARVSGTCEGAARAGVDAQRTAQRGAHPGRDARARRRRTRASRSKSRGRS